MAWTKPLIFTLTPFVGGMFGSFITRKNIPEWYNKELVKPDWRPPNWLFGPMWSCLYAGMGYASYLVWRDGAGFDGEAKGALTLYASQLALNWAWTPIFFGAKRLGLATLEIGVLWGTIAGCIYMFHPINTTASYLMVPYLGWVTLASSLSFWIWRNNPKKPIKVD